MLIYLITDERKVWR